MVVKNLSDQPHGFGAGVICVGAKASFAYPRTSVVADPQHEGFAYVHCPRSAPLPIGGAFELQSGGAPGSAVVDSTGPTYNKEGKLDGWQIGAMRNLTDTRVGSFIGAVCSSLPIHAANFSGTVLPGKTDTFTFSCRSGQRAVGGSLVASA